MRAEVLRLRTELETTSSFAGMVGTSPKMQQVYALMQQAAEGDIAVLIRGESGTGKELVAKSVHRNGPRKRGPFVALNCAAIPETLIESELFGHERGAFTGATEQRRGAFERAAGGTILLDEIGDMPYALQGKLLRVLQEREIQRVGGTASIPVDIRVMTATNKDIELLVRRGEFRQDLFYRVAAFPIEISPLRERREDIPLLAGIFSINTPNAPTSPSVAFPPLLCACCSSTIGPATCASWRMPSSAPCCWRPTGCCKRVACLPNCRRLSLPEVTAHRRPQSCRWPRSSGRH